MPINEKLSHWSALQTCFCGRWTVQRAPQRSPEGYCYERDNPADPQLSTKLRTWRVVGKGHEWVGPSACEVCGYDLTQPPEANLKAIPAKEWEAGVIVGSNFAHEHRTDVADFLPAGARVTFSGCNLDNVVLGATHAMVAKRDDTRGVVCTHNRVHRQTDGYDWICRWSATETKAAASPVQPVDLATAIATGRNVDPEKLPTEEVSDDGIRG